MYDFYLFIICVWRSYVLGSLLICQVIYGYELGIVFGVESELSIMIKYLNNLP